MCVYARDDSVISLVGILSSLFLFFFFFFLVNELVDKGGIWDESSGKNVGCKCRGTVEFTRVRTINEY